MRTLKYAILGLLCRGALTGYDIAKAFEKGLGNFWSAKHSQIYPELKKLTAEGLVEFSTVIQGEKLEKKLYTITQAGLEDFRQWIRRDEPPEPTPKDAFRLRVYLSDEICDQELLALFAGQLQGREERITILEHNLEEFYGGRDPAALDKRERGDYLVLQGAIMRERAYLNWLRWSAKLIRG